VLVLDDLRRGERGELAILGRPFLADVLRVDQPRAEPCVSLVGASPDHDHGQPEGHGRVRRVFGDVPPSLERDDNLGTHLSEPVPLFFREGGRR